jgi:3-oxoacyl-[acyl-carrier-protein] synthase-3
MTKRLPFELRGTGAYVPAEVVSNAYFTSYLDTSDEWIVGRTGIRERRRASAQECTSTMAVEASRKALQDARMGITDVDLIVCATATGDCPFPATATFVHGALGAGEIPAFDVSAACAGFLHALVVSAGLLSSGLYRSALVIGAETLTRYADREDRRTAILLGDGAGAAILTRTDPTDRGILHCAMGCDGTRAEYIWVPAGGSRLYTSATTVAERLHYMRMRGREVYKFAVVKMQELIDQALSEVGLTPQDLKLLIPHQSNLRIIESVRERMGLPKEKVAVNIDRYGNTSAASIPMALDEHRRSGFLKAGDIVLLIAIGAGLTWSTAVVRL